MLTVRRILCPVDFSEPSQRALRYALAIARWHESEVAVLHVQDVLLHAATVEAGAYPELAQIQYEELQHLIDAAGGSHGHVRAHVATGGAVPGILKHAAREGSDLIVMGTHGRSGLARAVLGSVTEGVVRQAGVPVLTIPPSAETEAFDEVMPFDPILCASDFSAACKRALDLAIVMGQEADARLILLHALQPPQLDPGITPVPFPLSARLDSSESRNDALAKLRRGLPGDATFRCRPEALVVDGRPADAILETADRENVKLIVMGIQTRGALARLLFGSTTRRVMQAAKCPVLSIRGGQAAEAWPAAPVSMEEGLAPTGR
jgi:nucleotide-binding universal stress UspA family protein